MKRRFIVAFATISVVCCLASPLPAAEITLFVAASLREVLDELSGSYARTHPGVTFKKNYGGSGALARQIDNGAPADIFISANTEWMAFMTKKQLVDGKSIATFAYNVLVFVGKPESKVTSLPEVVRLERIAIGSPRSVPAGEYALEALQKAGLDKTLDGKLVMARDVRECLLYADRGEVDGAFVYRTDALQAAQNVTILFAVPQDLYPRVTYPMALTGAGAKNAEAAAFFATLRSAAAQGLLKKHGFIVR